MAKDIEVRPDQEGRFKLRIENGDFASDQGFETSLWVSLFSDARATESQISNPQQRRGWMGNLASPVENRELGSLLFLAEQSRLNQNALNQNIDFAQKSLQPLVEDNQAKSVNVSGQIVPKQGIELKILIETDSNVLKFTLPLWKYLKNEHI